MIENDIMNKGKKLNKGRIKQKNVKILAGSEIFQDGQKLASCTNLLIKISNVLC